MLENLINDIEYGIYNSTVELELDKLIDKYAYTNINYKLRTKLFNMKRAIRPGWKPSNNKIDILRELWELYDKDDLWCNEFCGLSWEDWMKYVSNK